MRPRILSQPLSLGARACNIRTRQTSVYWHEPIEDAEAFIRHRIDAELDRMGSGMYVTDEEYEDIFFALLAVAVKLERGYNPERNPSFAGYASWVLSRRVVDEAPRRILGRTGGRIAERSHEELDEHTAHRTRHHQAQPEEPSDLDRNRRTDGRRLPGDRDRRTAWAHTVLGLRTAS